MIEHFLLLFLFIIEDGPYLLHIDDAVNLAGGKLAEPVFAAGSNPLLVKMHPLPVFG